MPAAEKEVVSSCPPGTKLPVPVRSQASSVIGRDASVDSEIRVIDSPTWGEVGNQVKEAKGAGCAIGDGGGGEVTVKLLGGLSPTLPASSSWTARSV